MKEIVKIIFLDIDGVLNVNAQGRDNYGQLFHKHFMDNLKRIVDETGAKIVLSSSWRKDGGLKLIKEMWVYRGLAGEVIDVTPDLSIQKKKSPFDDTDDSNQDEIMNSTYVIPRGCEIDFWLCSQSKYKIESYVILDDDEFGMLFH